MAIIFDRVNRIIEVEDPATSVTVQALIDAIRGFEDDQVNMDIPQVAEAAGKQVLSETTTVGITLKLLNWKVKFEERSTPTVCSVIDGNLMAVDEYGDPMGVIEPSYNTTVVISQSSSATIVQGESDWTQEEKDDLFGSVGEVESEVWAHGNRRLTSRDIESGSPGEHIPSEEQVLEVAAVLSTVKGLGFKSEEDALRVIRQLAQTAASSARASFKV